MMKKILFFILFSMPVVMLYAQDSKIVFTTVPSLTITPDAKSGSIGDVGAATTPDINSQFWNPAKYAFMDGKGGISLSYTPWLRKLVSDIDLMYLCGYYKLDDNQSFSGSFRYFSLGSIDLTDEQGSLLSRAHPNEYAVDLGYSRKFSEHFSGAATLRFIYSDLGNGSQNEEMFPGWTFAADIAAYYKTPISFQSSDAQLSFGLNISNIGGKISYDDNNTSQFIPTNLRLGTSFEFPIDEYNRVSISADASKLLVPTTYAYEQQELNDMSPIKGIFKSFGDAPGGFKEEMQEINWSAGLEYAYNKQFFVRAGYFHESQYKGNRQFFTAGAGFKLSMFQLDAGYVIATSQTNPLDQTLRFTLSFDFSNLKEVFK